MNDVQQVRNYYRALSLVYLGLMAITLPKVGWFYIANNLVLLFLGVAILYVGLIWMRKNPLMKRPKNEQAETLQKYKFSLYYTVVAIAIGVVFAFSRGYNISVNTRNFLYTLAFGAAAALFIFANFHALRIKGKI